MRDRGREIRRDTQMEIVRKRERLESNSEGEKIEREIGRGKRRGIGKCFRPYMAPIYSSHDWGSLFIHKLFHKIVGFCHKYHNFS